MLTLLRAALARLLPAADPAACGVPRSPRWAAARAAWLREHPACAACGTTKYLTVHHCEPFHLNRSRELDDTNFLTLCESPGHNDHLIFGHFLAWASFNKDVRGDAAAYLTKLLNRPRPQHTPETL